MDVRLISFGSIEVEGQRYDHDVVVEGGVVRKRKKGPSKRYRDEYGHTPLSATEAIPWSASRLVIGTGAMGQLPITPSLYEEARRRGVEIVAEPTEVACRLLKDLEPSEVSAILHATC
jgi:hypothetical protein